MLGFCHRKQDIVPRCHQRRAARCRAPGSLSRSGAKQPLERHSDAHRQRPLMADFRRMSTGASPAELQIAAVSGEVSRAKDLLQQRGATHI
jgi:hypothetical protein